MSLQDALRSLFETNLGTRNGERIVVFGDLVRPDEHDLPSELDRRGRLLATAREAADFAHKTYGSGAFVSFPATAASGAEPPAELWREALGAAATETLQREGLLAVLLSKQATPEQTARAREIVEAFAGEAADVVVAMSNNSTSHTLFRGLMNATGCRYASLPHFDPEMFFTSMKVDWEALGRRTARLVQLVNGAETLELTTPIGTSIRLGKQGRRAEGDDGILTRRGSFGNLPAGEVFLAPLEDTSEGVIVLEYAPMRRLDSPLELIVRGGRVTEIRGNERHAAALEAKFAESALNRNIAELGIGTNDRATCAENILEAEKIMGTVHIALGDNAGFGGTVRTPFHEDYVFYRPTLTGIAGDGTRIPILDDGNLLL